MATLKQKIEALLGRSDRDDEVRALIEQGVASGKIKEDAYRRAHEGGYYKASELEWCEHGRCWTTQATCFVNIKINGVPYARKWRQEAVDEHSFYCERSGRYFCLASFDRVNVDGEIVCRDAFSSQLFRWTNGTYHWTAENAEPDEDSLSPESDNHIAGYHSTRRSWNAAGAEAPKGIVYGVELEIESIGSRGFARNAAEKLKLIPETDGSLNHDRGVEIVGFPMTLADHQNPDKAWIKFLTAINGKVKTDAGDGYGMHVNINRPAMSELHQAKTQLFINSQQGLCERVAGRSSNQWSKYTPKNIHDSIREMRQGDGVKYEAIARRGPRRLEVRIFRSSTVIPVFLKNVEFVASVVDFAKDNSHRDMVEAKYIAWLKDNRQTYPNIAQFLIPIAAKKRKEVAACAS